MAPTEAPRSAAAPVLDGVLATMVLAGSGADVVKGEDTEDGNDTRQGVRRSGSPKPPRAPEHSGAARSAQPTSRRSARSPLGPRTFTAGAATGQDSMPTGLGICLARVSDVGRPATGPHEQTSTDRL
ncbi:hypothetical protein [Streptomyces sp. NPDC050538]|uniref:hypothetical protein n=1 Tax=Streptomyces sp. NPDC050538 TaxID=3365627 RepID=UPI0037B78EA0